MEERFQTELRCRRRKRGESVRELAQDIRRLLTLAYPGEQSRLVEHLGRDAFLTALDYPDLELRIRECEPQSLDAAVRLAQRFEIYRDVVGTPPGRSRQHATRQVTGDVTPDKKVDVLSLPELQVVVKEAVRCAVADCNGKKKDNVSASGCEKVAQKLSSPDGVCSGRQSPANSRKSGSSRRAKKLSRAVGQGQSTDQTPVFAARPTVTSQAEQQLQNMQSELTKLATDRGRLIAEKERIAKELAQYKNQQHVPDNLQSQQSPRRETRFYHRSSGGGNFEPNPNPSFNRGYNNSNFGYNTGQAAVNSGRVIGQSQPRCCWNCNSPQHLSLIHI